MKHLFVCCDGTWNSPDSVQDGVPVVTNVYKFYNAIERDPTGVPRQEPYYHSGVGAEEGGSFIARMKNKFLGGAFGTGLERNILSAYKWLCDTYEHDADPVRCDRIFMVGFSRGAFTVRSLSSFLWACGLLPREGGAPVAYAAVRARFEAYKAYKQAARKADEAGRQALTRTCRADNVVPKIHFLGVWDTVGALGIPRKLKWASIFGKDHEFNDTSLNDAIVNAYHALAMDERRSNFTPTLWATQLPPGAQRTLVQTWFPGAHADVGGGYKETGLSDVALKWMLDKAALHGAVFRKAAGAVVGDSSGVIHNSAREMKDILATQPRAVPLLAALNQEGAPGLALPFGQGFHAGALRRQTDPPLSQSPFWLTTVLAPQTPQTVEVFARDFWTLTGIYLRQGVSYTFQAAGTWQKGRQVCDANGYRSLAASLWRMLPRVAKLRVPNLRKLALVGVLITPGNPTIAGDPVQVTRVFAGDPGGKAVTAAVSGYLYCFPNDVQPLVKEAAFYQDNRGSLTLTVTRQ